jgi:hypothetical protein
MKLMYCAHCADLVKLFPEARTCLCGKSTGRYLPDNSTTEQTWPGLSVGIANGDFVEAQGLFHQDPNTFSPILSMRCWINPASEPDVKFLVDGKVVRFIVEPPVSDEAPDRVA